MAEKMEIDSRDKEAKIHEYLEIIDALAKLNEELAEMGVR